MSPCDCNLPEWECELLTREEKSGRAKAEDPTPTPIDPADIRPGDVVRGRREIEVTVQKVEPGVIIDQNGDGWRPSVWDFFIVHRPDPDAEAVQAIRSASYNIHHTGERMDPLPGLLEATDLLTKLREQGWDVTRRQNGQEHA